MAETGNRHTEALKRMAAKLTQRFDSPSANEAPPPAEVAGNAPKSVPVDSGATQRPGAAAADTSRMDFSAPQKVQPPQQVQDIDIVIVVSSPYQPRLKALGKKEIEDLARLIAANGQSTPIIVTPGTGDLAGKYVVHSGHRRCAAIRLLTWPTVRAIVRNDLTDRDARKLALTDNLCREDLSAFEQAAAFKSYCDDYGTDPAAAAEELGYSRRYGVRLLAIAKTDDAVLEVLREQVVPVRAAESLARIAGRDVKKAVRLAERFVSGAITTSALEAAATAGPRERSISSESAKIDFKVTAKQFNLEIHAPRKGLDDLALGQIRRALETFMGHIGLSDLHAEVTQRPEEVARAASGAVEAAD